MKLKHITLILFLPTIIHHTSCKNRNSPKYTDFVHIEPLHQINLDGGDQYLIADANYIAVDDDGQLHVLSYSDGTITVFDQNGHYMRTIGRSGQGPNELEGPTSFYIFNYKYYVYEDYKQIKIWDMEGNYVSRILLKKRGYRVKYRPYNQGFIGFRQTPVGNSNFDYLAEVARYDSNLNQINIMGKSSFTLGKDLGHSVSYLALDSHLNCYLPQSRDEYIINKFDIHGEKTLSFGRPDYVRTPWSNRLKDVLKQRIGRSKSYGFPVVEHNYPPIVRQIFVDAYDHVWVLVGESNIDTYSEGWSTKSTVDIFSNGGEWLASIESPYLQKYCMIHKDRLYVPPMTVDDYYIGVYKLHYKEL